MVLALWTHQMLTGLRLEYTAFGKPSRPTYEYADRMMHVMARACGLDSSALRVYGGVSLSLICTICFMH